ncbi:hypothetical protein ACIBCT_11715 [Streptosporangium sp. NPDC050855]|uniref:hypothetical protein n=1 Tax=Streptosporangium sp. NPDC050855 TaxID=3366194 RepID=UPI00379ED46B
MKEELTPQEALRRIGEVDRRARRPARVAGLIYLIVGLATIVYWPVMNFGPAWSQLTVGLLWLVLTVASTWYLGRMSVEDREVTWAGRPTGPVTVTYLGAVAVVFLVGLFLVPDDPGTGWKVALVVLAACASLPPLYAAWRVLRAAR